jgi:hypothetical protein
VIKAELARLSKSLIYGSVIWFNIHHIYFHSFLEQIIASMGLQRYLIV